MTIIKIKNQKAIKDHRCDWCSGVISKGNTYENSYEGDSFTWKAHIYCRKIADELNMFDWATEGVTGDDFHENITSEYLSIMSKNEGFERKSFVFPKFFEILNFVLSHYKINK